MKLLDSHCWKCGGSLYLDEDDNTIKCFSCSRECNFNGKPKSHPKPPQVKKYQRPNHVPHGSYRHT